MFDGQRDGRQFDYNWILTDNVESLAAYAETFKLGKLVPLTDILPIVTDEEMATVGLLELAKQRREKIMQLPSEIKENTTYYSVLNAKQWAEMKHDLTKPKPPLARALKDLNAGGNWVGSWMQAQYIPTVFSFIMTNSAIVNEDTFWEIRLANTDVWRRLVAEHIPPEHQFKRRTK
jgi:hypothetical protein